MRRWPTSWTCAATTAWKTWASSSTTCGRPPAAAPPPRALRKPLFAGAGAGSSASPDPPSSRKGEGGFCLEGVPSLSRPSALAAQGVTDAAEELVEEVAAVEEGEQRPAAHPELLPQGEEPGVVRIDLQPVPHGADGARAVARQQAGAGQVEVVVRLVELDLDGMAAELEPLPHPLLPQSDAVAQVGVEDPGQARFSTLGDLSQVTEALVPVPPPAAVDPPA